MKYRVAYASPASEALNKLPDPADFKVQVQATIGTNPYGHASTQVGPDKDRREATVAGVILRYMVSTGVLTVTVVRLIPPP
ncbi:hypothetical protein ACIQU4_27615 [Streptomyces sp. NPDC090741]|uniref:hypothetical protein n=1 Tax=Streptomyces sp. NPDC090741 TaxID=3365967 RepID=UPI00382CFD7F